MAKAFCDINRIRCSQCTYCLIYVTNSFLFLEDNLEEVMNLLSETNWIETSVEELRGIRNKICELSGVPAPAVKIQP